MSVVQNRKAVKAENVHGGNGYILRDVLLQDNQLNGICTFAACITLEPGCEIVRMFTRKTLKCIFLSKAMLSTTTMEKKQKCM